MAEYDVFKEQILSKSMSVMADNINWMIDHWKYPPNADFCLRNSVWSTLQLAGINITKRQLNRIFSGRKPRLQSNDENDDKGKDEKQQKRLTAEELSIVNNTIAAYKKIPQWDPLVLSDFIQARNLLVPELSQISPALTLAFSLPKAQISYDSISIAVLLFCDILREFSQGTAGILARLWLVVALRKRSEKFSSISIEEELLLSRTKYNEMLKSLQNGPLGSAEMLILEILSNTLKKNLHKKDISIFLTCEKQMLKEAFDPQRLTAIFGSTSMKRFHKIFNSLAEEEPLDEHELEDLRNNLEWLVLPLTPYADSFLDQISNELEKYQKDDINPLPLASIIVSGMNEIARFWREKSNCDTGKALNDAHLKKHAASKLSPELFQRCCIEVHNRGIQQGYKGRGQGSPRSFLIQKCVYLKTNKSTFCRAWKEFQRNLNDNQKSTILSPDEYECPSTNSNPYCKK